MKLHKLASDSGNICCDIWIDNASEIYTTAEVLDIADEYLVEDLVYTGEDEDIGHMDTIQKEAYGYAFRASFLCHAYYREMLMSPK